MKVSINYLSKTLSSLDKHGGQTKDYKKGLTNQKKDINNPKKSGKHKHKSNQ